MTAGFIEDPQLDDISNPLLRDFFNIWLVLNQERAGPHFKNFCLTEFTEHLPFMVMIDHHEEAGRFQIRFSGSDYVVGFGADNTDRFVDVMPNAETLLGRFQRLVKDKKPYVVTGTQLTWGPKDFRFFDAVVCPLFDDKGDVFSILCRVDFLT